MNYKDNGYNDYMGHITNMVSNVKYYENDLESFLYDIIRLVMEMVPSLVKDVMTNGQFDISFDAAAFRKSIEDALRF